MSPRVPATPHPFPRAATRAEELRLLRAAHGREGRLEVEELAVREELRALTWQVERARRRLAATTVTVPERRAHHQAAERLGAAHRRALALAVARREVRDEIAARTRRLRRGRS